MQKRERLNLVKHINHCAKHSQYLQCYVMHTENGFECNENLMF